MTQPAAPEQVETDAQKVARAQIIIDLQRTRIAEETDHSIGLESQLVTVQRTVEQQQQIITGMATEIARLKTLAGEDDLIEGPPVDEVEGEPLTDEDEPGHGEPS